MRFAVFEGRDKRTVYVNPSLVTYIRDVNERSCVIYVGPEHAVEISMQANLVAEDIQKASK
jgi:hypothetical protein